MAPQHDEASGAAGPSARQALILLIIIVVAVAAFIGISEMLGLIPVFGGFLFVFYFMGICHADRAAFFPSAAGAFGGLAMALLLKLLPEAMGVAGMALALVLLLMAIYALLMGWGRILINNAFMLFLTVATIPLIHEPISIAGIARSVGLAVVLCGMFVWIRQRRARGSIVAKNRRRS